MSTKHHTESSHSHNARKQHDREARAHEQQTGNPWHESNTARIGLGIVAVVAIVTLTLLFVGGVIRW